MALLDPLLPISMWKLKNMTNLFIWCSCEARRILDVKESDVLHVWMHVPWYLRKFRGGRTLEFGQGFSWFSLLGVRSPRWFRWFPNLDHTRGPWNHGKKFTSTDLEPWIFLHGVQEWFLTERWCSSYIYMGCATRLRPAFTNLQLFIKQGLIYIYIMFIYI